MVKVRTNLPSQDLTHGDGCVVISAESDRVRLSMADGTEKVFPLAKLAKNLDRDAVWIFALEQVELHVGDRMR